MNILDEVDKIVLEKAPEKEIIYNFNKKEKKIEIIELEKYKINADIKI